MPTANDESNRRSTPRPPLTELELARARAMAALDGGTTAGDLADALGIPATRASGLLRKLAKAGELTLEGRTRGARYRRAAK